MSGRRAMSWPDGLSASRTRSAGQAAPQGRPAARGPVAVAHHGHRCGPLDVQIRIEEVHRHVVGRIVSRIDAVAHVGGGRQGLVSVQESGRDVQHGEIHVVQPEGLDDAERGRLRTSVDNDVKDGSVGDPHQFGFAATDPSVHPAHDALDRTGLAVLDKRVGIDSRVPRDPRVEGPGEEAAIVGMRGRLEEQETGQPACANSHGETITVEPESDDRVYRHGLE